MQDNQIAISDEGIIEIRAGGDQTVDSVQAMGDQAHELAIQQAKAGKRVLVLDDLLRLGTVPADARRRVADLVKAGEFDKFAMLGTGEELRAEAEALLQETGRGSHVKYFEDREACVAWLLQP